MLRSILGHKNYRGQHNWRSCTEQYTNNKHGYLAAEIYSSSCGWAAKCSNQINPARRCQRISMLLSECLDKCLPAYNRPARWQIRALLLTLVTMSDHCRSPAQLLPHTPACPPSMIGYRFSIHNFRIRFMHCTYLRGFAGECGCWKWRFSLLSFTVFGTFYIHGHTTAFTWCDCPGPWRYFKVITLFHIKFLKNGAWCSKSYYRLLIGNHTLAFDWCHFLWSWIIFEVHFTLLCPISRKLYRIHPQKLKLLIRNQISAFRWYECRSPWQYFKVIRLFHIEFLANGKSNYRVLMENHTLAFDWCHVWWPWSTFDGHFSLCGNFHVHFINLWQAFTLRSP